MKNLNYAFWKQKKILDAYNACISITEALSASQLSEF